MVEERPRIPADQSAMEYAVRQDERERVLAEVADDQAGDDERDRAMIALLIGATLAGAVLVPAWAAIIGCAVWVFRFVSGL